MQGKSLIILKNRSATPATPTADHGYLYMNGDALKLELDDGSVVDLGGLSGPLYFARNWGAIPGAGDVTTEIQTALDAVPSYGTLYFEPGTYGISDTIYIRRVNVVAYGAIFDLGTNVPTSTFSPGIPENHNGTSYLSIASREAGTLTDKAAVIWDGSVDGTRPYLNFIRGLQITRTASDNKMGTRLYAGLVALSPWHCVADDIAVTNYNCGLVLVGRYATTGGCVHNKFRNIRPIDCRYGYTLYTSGSGWVNQNTIELGRPSVSSTIRGDSEWTTNFGVEWEYCRLLYHSSATYGAPNGNRFVDISFEAEIGRKARVEGSDNFFHNCRWETIRTNSPLLDITIGEASRSATNWTRNRFEHGGELHNIVAKKQIEFLSSGGSVNYGNPFISNHANWYAGRVNVGDTDVTAHRFSTTHATNPVIGVLTSADEEVIHLHNVYSALSAQGTLAFLDTGEVVRNAFGMKTASPYDFATLAGLEVAGVLRMRPSSIDALLTNPQSGGKMVFNVGTGKVQLYSASSTNNDLLGIADSSQNTRILMKGGSTDWGTGYYGVIEFWNATPSRDNAIMLGSTAFGATRPISTYGSVWFNMGAGANKGRFRGSGITSLMEWDAVNDRVGVNTTSPDTLWHVNGAGHYGGDLEIDGALNHDGTTVGFFGVTPAARPAAYTPTNVTTDRSYDANSTTLDEVADVLGTLIADLQSLGLIQ